jgi:hypothetical protein
MKKLGVFVIIILLISILSHFIVLAQNAPDVPLANDAEKIGNLAEKIPTDTDSAKETAREYLAKEWIIILRNNTYARPIVIIIEWTWLKTSPVINPVSQTVVGAKPADGWKFIIALALVILLAYWIVSILKMYSLFSKGVGTIIGIAISVMIGVTGLYGRLSELISSLLTNWWVKLILVVIIIIAFFVTVAFSKIFKQIKEKADKAEEQRNREELKVQTQAAKKFGEGFKKVANQD